MYLVVRNYKKIAGNKKELSSKIDSEFVPLIKKINGFVDYYCLFTGESSMISVSIFNDKKGCDESVKLAADWVKKVGLAADFPEKPEILQGDVFTDVAGAKSMNMKSAA